MEPQKVKVIAVAVEIEADFEVAEAVRQHLFNEAQKFVEECNYSAEITSASSQFEDGEQAYLVINHSEVLCDQPGNEWLQARLTRAQPYEAQIALGEVTDPSSNIMVL